MFLTIIVFLLTFLILVVIHEFGHFIAAKKFNIKVLEFGFGIPPRIWGKKVGETLVSINWLPFGGFVRLFGEDEVEKQVLESKRSFAASPISKRIIVVFAGVVMNLLLAWILFWIFLGASNFKTELPIIPVAGSNHQFIGVNQSIENLVIIGEVKPNSPADQAGIKSGDRVVALNDKFLSTSEELVNKTKELAGQEIKLTLSNIDQTVYKTLTVTPRENPPDGEGSLGITLGSFEFYNLSYTETWQKILSGPSHSINITTYTINVLGGLISSSLQTRDIEPVSSAVSGPIGIGSVIGEILKIENPILPYINFLGWFSLNLAIFNVLPFPGLDGGRLFFLIIEAATRKKVNAQIEKYVHTIGLALLLTLALVITISDIRKFIL